MGTAAPDFTLRDQNNQDITLSKYFGKKNVLLVFFPQSSIFRLLLPLAPLYGAIAGPRHPAWRFGMLGLGLLGQWWWIYEMLALGNSYTQIP